MSFPPTNDGIRRRPNLWKYLSFSHSSNKDRSYIDQFEKPYHRGEGEGNNLMDLSYRGGMGKNRRVILFSIVFISGLLFLFKGSLFGNSRSGNAYQNPLNVPPVANPTPSNVKFPIAVEDIEHGPDQKDAPTLKPADIPLPTQLQNNPAQLEKISAPSFPSNDKLSPFTSKCSSPLDPTRPLVQYALMVDAGSTGSRIHVFKFNNCGASPELENEVFQQLQPGLSSYDTDAIGAAKSLDPLLDRALKEVPKVLHGCTPVAVKATAGLRKLGEAKSNKILLAVQKRLNEEYPFPLIEKDGVVVMDGKDEGVYAWITINYLLKKIGSSVKTPTVATFDLGGGSTQIVFEPTFEKDEAGLDIRMQEGEHKYVLTFGGRNFTLYQHSHLGYGLMSARESIHQALVKNLLKEDSTAAWKNKNVVNPCINVGMNRNVVVEYGGENYNLTMVGPEKPSVSECKALAEKVIDKKAPCSIAPCSFNGVHQPSLATTFQNEDIYIFSYFYDRTQPLGMPKSFTVSELENLTNKVCAGEKGWDTFADIPDALKELRDRPEWCLDLSYMVSLLTYGYDIPLSRQVKIEKQIDNNELGWCLGAALPLLDPKNSGWSCRA